MLKQNWLVKKLTQQNVVCEKSILVRNVIKKGNKVSFFLMCASQSDIN